MTNKLTEWLRSGTQTVSPLLLVFIAVVVVGSTAAVAMSITETNPTQSSLFTSQAEESDFTLDSLDAEIQGQHEVLVDFELTNTADTTEEAGVIVQLLDEQGDVIAEEEFETGQVSSGDTWGTQLTIEENGLVGQYEETVVIVNQK